MVIREFTIFLYLPESGTKIVIFMKIVRLHHVINFKDNYTYFFCLKAYIEQYWIMQRNHFHIKDFCPETAKSDLGVATPQIG